MIRLFNFEEKKVIYMEDEAKADELINAGKAVKLELPELERLEKQASDIYDEYMAKVKQIKQSNNPIYTEEVKAYELERLKKEYEQKSQEIEAEYQKYREKAIEEAKIRAAQARMKITKEDRAVAEQFKNRALLKIVGTSDKGKALSEIKNEIELLTDEQKTALQGYIAEILKDIDGHILQKQAVISAVQDVCNEDLLAYEVAKQLPASVKPIEAFYEEIAKKVVNEPSALSGGGINKEFYEEYIKGANK